MKKTNLLSFLVVIGLILSSTKLIASITITLTAGELYQSNGVTPMADNGLIQLIADTGADGFTAPSNSSFVGGSPNDIILASFALDHNTFGSSGCFSNLINYTLLAPVVAGNQLMFRWFPLLTISSSQPGVTSYGQFTSLTATDFGNGWIVPADGGVIDLNLLTLGQGGSHAESYGVANLLVPEPTSFAMLGSGLLMIGSMIRRRK